MTCYDIVIDYGQTIDLSGVLNLIKTCYDIVVDYEWTVNLFSDL